MQVGVQVGGCSRGGGWGVQQSRGVCVCVWGGGGGGGGCRRGCRGGCSRGEGEGAAESVDPLVLCHGLT